jgi:hypothetical protein
MTTQVGEKITQRRTMFVIGHYGIVARNGRVMVPGMVWGEDIIIRNEFLVDGAHAIALTLAEVHALGLRSLLAALERHPQEQSRHRKAAAKFMLIRGIRKIAAEVAARRRGQFSKNDYVKTLLYKFEEDEGAAEGVEEYEHGDNEALDQALRGLRGGNTKGAPGGAPSHSSGGGGGVDGVGGCGGGGGSGGGDGGRGGGGGGGIGEEEFRTLMDKMSEVGRAMERRFEALADQNQAAVAEARHMAKVFNDVLIQQHGLVQAFRSQVNAAGQRIAPKNFQIQQTKMQQNEKNKLLFSSLTSTFVLFSSSRRALATLPRLPLLLLRGRHHSGPRHGPHGGHRHALFSWGHELRRAAAGLPPTKQRRGCGGGGSGVGRGVQRRSFWFRRRGWFWFWFWFWRFLGGPFARQKSAGEVHGQKRKP